MRSVVYVGLDVHKDSIVIAFAREGRQAAETWKTIPCDGVRLCKTLQLLVTHKEDLRVCYEAGPTGFGLCRRLRKAGIDCIVMAPSLVPGKPGERVKTDRRDARKLAHFLRSGDLTEVHVPDSGFNIRHCHDIATARPRRRLLVRLAVALSRQFFLGAAPRFPGLRGVITPRLANCCTILGT